MRNIRQLARVPGLAFRGPLTPIRRARNTLAMALTIPDILSGLVKAFPRASNTRYLSLGCRG